MAFAREKARDKIVFGVRDYWDAPYQAEGYLMSFAAEVDSPPTQAP